MKIEIGVAIGSSKTRDQAYGLKGCLTLGVARYPTGFDNPAASYGLIKVDQRMEENSLGLRLGKLGAKKAALRIENLDIACVTVIKS